MTDQERVLSQHDHRWAFSREVWNFVCEVCGEPESSDAPERVPSPCGPCRGTGLFRAKNEPPDDCMTCGGTGWVANAEQVSSLCPMCERVGYPVNDCPSCTAKQWLCACGYWNMGPICTHCGLTAPARGSSPDPTPPTPGS